MDYCKVMFNNNTFINGQKYKYRINEENIAENWNPSGITNKTTNGFYFSSKETIFRWLIRGDTLYDAIIPDDAEILTENNLSVPNGVFVTNKIILTNPQPITDKLAMELYKISNLPEKTYYKALAGCAIRGHLNTCKEIIQEKINKNNIDLVLSEFQDFVTPNKTTIKGNAECYNIVLNILKEIQNNE